MPPHVPDAAPATSSDDVPRLTLPASDAALERLVAQLSLIALRHPVAAQAVFTALVAEGRRFARTPEGQRWRAALASSEFVRRGRALWESSVLNLLEDDGDTVLPSAFGDAVVRAASRGEIHTLVREVVAGGDDGDRP